MLQEDAGGRAWQDSWKEQKWQAPEQTAEKKEWEPERGQLLGHQVRAEGRGS